MLELKACIPGRPGDSKVYPPDAIVIDRVACEDGVHWVVDGKDKGVFFSRANSIKARILDILYNQAGNGWIPHRTFIEKTGWTEKEYYGKAPDTGRMQKQLTDIRTFLGVEVHFRRDHGVRFAEKVVKSRK